MGLFFFQHCKISLHFSFLHDFWWEVCYNLYPFSSKGKVIFPLWLPWSFSFCLWFICSLNVIYLDVVFLIFILLGVLWASWISGWCLSLFGGNSQPLLFKPFLLCSLFHLLLVFRLSLCYTFWLCLTGLLYSFFFFPLCISACELSIDLSSISLIFILHCQAYWWGHQIILDHYYCAFYF